MTNRILGTQFLLNNKFPLLRELASPRQTILITDENVIKAHPAPFKPWRTIVLRASEVSKKQSTVNEVIDRLIEWEADRKTLLVGVGGGVITDITGYVASIYMRGLSFGFVPTTLLAMVDAAIGGKNGIDVGAYKNLVGTIRQPAFILYDQRFLKTLPNAEWRNGFAEIIKHACIRDRSLFRMLEGHTMEDYRKKRNLLTSLINRNARIKISVVSKDPFEQGDRRLLNFGHTLGHAIENHYRLSHGEAISIGMAYASQLSENLLGFRGHKRVTGLLRQYGLPVNGKFDREKVFNTLRMDKKRERNEIRYVLLQKLGKGVVKEIALTQLKKDLVNYS